MGGSSKSQDIGTWYYLAYHHGLSLGPVDAFIEFRVGTKTAWSGVLTASSVVYVNRANLLGGEKDQGGVVGNLRVMFGEATQMPNSYLASVFGSQTAAWRGFLTVAWEGGKYGANNPYPQKASYRFRKIKKGWDNDTCWYEEKAEIVMADGLAIALDAPWEYQITADEASTGDPGHTNLTIPTSGWLSGQAPFGNRVSDNTLWPVHTTLWMKKTVTIPPGRAQTLTVSAENGCVVFINGVDSGAYNRDNVQVVSSPDVEIPLVPGGTYDIAIKAFDEEDMGGASTTFVTARSVIPGLSAMNPAHILYFLRTSEGRGREPIDNMADANLKAAADWFYDQGFGLCGTRKAASVSPADYEQQICKIAGCSFTRSVEDGKFYIDIANGEYVIDDLPILNDDDILSFKEIPTVLDNVINSVSVRYFDPLKKQMISSPPVRALALIAEFGENHQIYEYPEIPTASLAARVALRELLASITPTRRFEFDCNRTPASWRRYEYFRLQAPKRGIADMVCLAGDIQHGKLKSGGVKLVAVQDIYGVQNVSYVEYEPGVDSRPDEVPTAVTIQKVIEAPYIEVCTQFTESELADIAADVGFIAGMAVNPASCRDFTLYVKPSGGSYTESANEDFCPTSTVNEVASWLDEDFTLDNMKDVGDVLVGDPVLWDNEICRVDAVDATAGTISLGRGCADTVPQQHAADSRLYFFRDHLVSDGVQYTDGETVNVKFPSNTGSNQLDISAASELSLTFDQRMIRPYPPGNVKIGGVAYPTTVTGTFTVTWNHRNRVVQAEQLIDTTMSSVTPADNTRYALRFLDNTAALLIEKTDIGPGTASVTLNYTGNVTMELYTIDSNGISQQKHSFTFAYTPPGGTPVTAITATAYTPVDEATIIDGGDLDA